MEFSAQLALVQSLLHEWQQQDEEQQPPRSRRQQTNDDIAPSLYANFAS
jgi:hypothetical protein